MQGRKLLYKFTVYKIKDMTVTFVALTNKELLLTIYLLHLLKYYKDSSSEFSEDKSTRVVVEKMQMKKKYILQ